MREEPFRFDGVGRIQGFEDGHGSWFRLGGVEDRVRDDERSAPFLALIGVPDEQRGAQLADAPAPFGWRQALAIEPAATDVRERMQLLRDDGPSEPGWVPSVPSHAGAWLFAALWIATWALAWIARVPGSWAAGWPVRLGTAACFGVLEFDNPLAMYV